MSINTNTQMEALLLVKILNDGYVKEHDNSVHVGLCDLHNKIDPIYWNTTILNCFTSLNTHM